MSDIKTEKLRKTTKKAPKKETKRVADGITTDPKPTILEDLLVSIQAVGTSLNELREVNHANFARETNNKLAVLYEDLQSIKSKLNESPEAGDSTQTTTLDNIHALIADIQEHIKSGNQIGQSRDEDMRKTLNLSVQALDNLANRVDSLADNNLDGFATIRNHLEAHAGSMRERFQVLETGMITAAKKADALEMKQDQIFASVQMTHSAIIEDEVKPKSSGSSWWVAALIGLVVGFVAAHIFLYMTA